MKRKIGTAVLLMVSILIINVDGTYAKTSKNLLKNPGFESSDFSMWKYKGTGRISWIIIRKSCWNLE